MKFHAYNPWMLRGVLYGIAVGAAFTADAANSPAAKPPVQTTTSAAVKATAAPALPKLSAQQIVDRNLAARGGVSAWKAVQSMTLSGKLDAGRVRKDGGGLANNPVQARLEAKARAKLIVEGKYHPESEKIIQLPFTLDLARPNKQRLEVPFQGNTAVQVYNGSSGWKLRPYLGRHDVEVYTKDELAIAANEQALDGPLVDSAAKGTQVSLVGTDQVEGQPAYHLSLKLKDGSTRGLWIDGKSFLEVRIEGEPRRRDGRPRAVMTFLADYKKVNGLMIPHLRETRVVGDAHAERIVIEKVVINPTLPPATFSKPT